MKLQVGVLVAVCVMVAYHGYLGRLAYDLHFREARLLRVLKELHEGRVEGFDMTRIVQRLLGEDLRVDVQEGDGDDAEAKEWRKRLVREGDEGAGDPLDERISRRFQDALRLARKYEAQRQKREEAELEEKKKKDLEEEERKQLLEESREWARTNRTLVIYNYKEDPSSASNLRFLLTVGITEDDPVDYLILTFENAISVDVPLNLFNVRIQGISRSYPLEAHGRALDYIPLEEMLRRYRYFVLMDSTVRGPFFPAYWPPFDATPKERATVFHWSKIFTSRLDEGDVVGDAHHRRDSKYKDTTSTKAKVKLVGPSLVCSSGSGSGPMLETHFVATDRIGFELMVKEGILSIKKSIKEVEDAEVRLSRLMFERGYTIDTTSLPYSNRGIDWREVTNHFCNERKWSSRPGQSFFDVEYNPLEQVFFKLLWDPKDFGRNPSELDSVNPDYFYRYSNWILNSKSSGYVRAAPKYCSLSFLSSSVIAVVSNLTQNITHHHHDYHLSISFTVISICRLIATLIDTNTLPPLDGFSTSRFTSIERF